MIRILFLAANPARPESLDLGNELRAIDASLQRGRYRDLFHLESAFAVRRSELIERIHRHSPTILHFSGHGAETGELLFAGEGARIAPADPAALADVFRILARKAGLRCMVLNACFSESQARAIAEHVDCVIGMNRAVPDATAIEFAAQLYSSLAFGSSVQEAFELARTQLDPRKRDEASIPRLLTKPGIEPAALHLAGAPPPPPPRRETFDYDAFLSYAPQDAGWVNDVLVSHLTARDLQIATAEDAATIGVSRVKNIADGVDRAKRTVAVVTPEYLASQYGPFGAAIAIHVGVTEAQYRLIPFHLKPVPKLPILLDALTGVDFNDPRKGGGEALRRLADGIAAPLPTGGFL
jgi:hypothetical protein